MTPTRPVPPPSAARAAALGNGVERRERDDRPSHYYDSILERRDALRLSRWLIRRANPEAIARRRRARYRTWLDGVARLSRARALFPMIPETCAPYMFPLLISRPDVDFFLLKRAGVPIWRWDDMATSSCPTAQACRLDLLHLPCHQSLSDAQMEWMLDAVREVLA